MVRLAETSTSCQCCVFFLFVDLIWQLHLPYFFKRKINYFFFHLASTRKILAVVSVKPVCLKKESAPAINSMQCKLGWATMVQQDCSCTERDSHFRDGFMTTSPPRGEAARAVEIAEQSE